MVDIFVLRLFVVVLILLNRFRFNAFSALAPRGAFNEPLRNCVDRECIPLDLRLSFHACTPAPSLFGGVEKLWETCGQTFPAL